MLLLGPTFSQFVEKWVLLYDVLLVNVWNTSVGFVPSLVHDSSIVFVRNLLVFSSTGTFAGASRSLGFDDFAKARRESGVIGGDAVILNDTGLVMLKGEAWAFLSWWRVTHWNILF